MSSDNFQYGRETAGLANYKEWYLEFEHVATTRSVRFKAFVTDYNESFESSWNEETVFGRMDPIMTFSNTTRKISLAWDVIAENEAEAKANVLRCSDLIKMLYPVYENAGGHTDAGSDGQFTQGQMTASPLMKIKFANVITNSTPNATIDHLIGTLSGLQYTPDLNVGWVDPANGELYPKVIRLTTQVTVIHTHKLGWDHDTDEWRGGEDASGLEGTSGNLKGGFPWRVSSTTQASTTAADGDTDDDGEGTSDTSEVEDREQGANQDGVLSGG